MLPFYDTYVFKDNIFSYFIRIAFKMIFLSIYYFLIKNKSKILFVIYIDYWLVNIVTNIYTNDAWTGILFY